MDSMGTLRTLASVVRFEDERPRTRLGMGTGSPIMGSKLNWVQVPTIYCNEYLPAKTWPQHTWREFESLPGYHYTLVRATFKLSAFYLA